MGSSGVRATEWLTRTEEQAGRRRKTGLRNRKKETEKSHSAKTHKGLCQSPWMAHRSFLVSIAESPASDVNLVYSVGRGLANDGEPLAHRCFSLRRNLAYLSPPKRASPDSPWLAHSVPTPYGVNLGHRGLRFCTTTEQRRPDFHWFGNVLFNSRRG